MHLWYIVLSEILNLHIFTYTCSMYALIQIKMTQEQEGRGRRTNCLQEEKWGSEALIINYKLINPLQPPLDSSVRCLYLWRMLWVYIGHAHWRSSYTCYSHLPRGSSDRLCRFSRYICTLIKQRSNCHSFLNLQKMCHNSFLNFKINVSSDWKKPTKSWPTL